MEESDFIDGPAQGAFGGSLTFGPRPALLVVDVVRAYVQNTSPLYAGVERALASNIRLIDLFRAARLPVVYTRVAYQAGGVDGGEFYKKIPGLKAFLEGSVLGQFAEGIAPRKDEITITKQYASAFFGTSLASTLTGLHVDTLVIGGFSTSGCIRATAVDAIQYGFKPFLVEEACGDRDVTVQNANLFDLKAKYAEVMHEAEMISLLRNFMATQPS